MTEHTIFDEAKEDYERQRLEALWKRYGAWMLVLAVGVVIATASSSAYRNWQTDRNESRTADLLAATKDNPDTAKNIDMLQGFADRNRGSAQADIALLRAGALAEDRNDNAKAVTLFDEVAGDAKADPAFRQLGDLLAVQAQLDNGDPAALDARLQPLTVEGAPWRFSALETQGYLALRTGDKEKAKRIFTGLAQDARVPPTMAARATDIMRSLN